MVIGCGFRRSGLGGSGLNRGTVNVNDEYEPAADGDQNVSLRERPALNEPNGEVVSDSGGVGHTDLNIQYLD